MRLLNLQGYGMVFYTATKAQSDLHYLCALCVFVVFF